MSLFNLFLTLSLAVGVFGDGEVIVMSKPASIEFRGHEEVDYDIVKDICSTSLGFTTYQTSDWSGMYITDPFHFAQCVMIVSIPGVSSTGITDGHKFPLIGDAPMDEIFTNLEMKMVERNPAGGENQTLIEIILEDDVKAAEINLNKGSLRISRPSVTYLNEEEDEDSSFISQIALLEAITRKIKEKGVSEDGLPDIISMSLGGLHPLMDMHGENSNTATEAKQLVMSGVHRMKEVLDEVYQNKTLFLVVTSDTAHTRRYRRATLELRTDRNLAPVYDENYPVFFNIFFWFTIAFIMSIIATSMVTACMDPGRDSIIYRMTSTRMKKDN